MLKSNQNVSVLQSREVLVYLMLTSTVICGLLASIVSAPKLLHIGITFPFANIVFSIFTYPIVDCICELWGKQIARQTIWIGLLMQSLFAIVIHVSIIAPPASFWLLQDEYAKILATSGKVVFASLLAFSVSQIFDVYVYQRLKEITKGKWLWLRSNFSIYTGQIIDSTIFVLIVFGQSEQRFSILFGSIVVKICLGFLMTPVVYSLVMAIHRFLGYKTQAFCIAPAAGQ